MPMELDARKQLVLKAIIDDGRIVVKGTDAFTKQ